MNIRLSAPPVLAAARGAPRHAARALAIGLIGPGHVGSALLDQLCRARSRLAHDEGIDLELRGIAASRRMWLACDDPGLWRSGGAFHPGRAETWRPTDLVEFAACVRGDDDRATILVDCTASDAVAGHYAQWLDQGIHVIAANKRAGSGPLPRWQAMLDAGRGRAQFHQEASVGAGLPVLGTLRDLIATGDELRAVDGMLSGSMARLLARHDGRQPFSRLVLEARERGWTEPDPRDDLSGLDVARKLVILARSAGWPLSLADVEVQGLVPDALAALPLPACLERLETLDAPLADALDRASASGGVLRHVAHVDASGQASVKLAVLPAGHPYAHARPGDNVIEFTTRRYCDNPLSVQGPGAGPDVTAAGVFTDVLRVAGSPVAHA